MKIIKGEINKINQIDGLEKSVVVIGNFDGVHTYHQKLIKKAQKLGKAENLSVVLITFDQSFEDYFNHQDTKIYSNVEKMNLIDQNFAIDYYVELKVGKTLMSYDKMKFMIWLKEVVHLEKIVEGSDFTFGTNKEGKVKDLEKFFGKNNVIVIYRRKWVSSTKIKKELQTGKVKKAEKHLLKPLKKN